MAPRKLAADEPIDDFVALGWMDWRGGSLEITALGQMALIRIRNRLVTTGVPVHSTI